MMFCASVARHSYTLVSDQNVGILQITDYLDPKMATTRVEYAMDTILY